MLPRHVNKTPTQDAAVISVWLKLLDLTPKPSQQLILHQFHIQVVNLKGKEQFRHPGVEDPLHLVLVVGHVALEHVVFARRNEKPSVFKGIPGFFVLFFCPPKDHPTGPGMDRLIR